MKHTNLIVRPWEDYELLDSGNNKKLERFGEYVLIRPETQALWSPAHPEAWESADAEFVFVGNKGAWRGAKLPEAWNISFQGACLELRPTAFKHVGLFPEQRCNWEWTGERIEKIAANEKSPHILNLFGYTGAATLLAALSGGSASLTTSVRVTHVDASEQSNKWAKKNAMLSKISEDKIRFITEDALKFAEREARRGVQYDGILLDPPAFGRGAKKEVWRIEENLSELLGVLTKILSPRPGSFLLLNGYAAGYSPESFRQVVENFFPESKASGEYGELHIAESKTERVIPSGIFVRLVR